MPRCRLLFRLLPPQVIAARKVTLEPHVEHDEQVDRKSTRLNSSHLVISYAVFCLKKQSFGSAGPSPDHEEPDIPARRSPARRVSMPAGASPRARVRAGFFFSNQAGPAKIPPFPLSRPLRR